MGRIFLLWALSLLPCVFLVSCQGSRTDEQADKAKEEAVCPAYFEEVTSASGIDFTYHNGEEADRLYIIEGLGGGGAAIDYDKDGLYDLFVTGGGYFDGPDKKQIKGYPCKLYKNLGNWKFRDVTAEVGLDATYPYTHAAVVGDYNRDGWPDLLVTGFGKVMLFRNQRGKDGKRRFVDVTAEAGLAKPRFQWPTGAVFADLDGDGWVDLYVCEYVNWTWANDHKCAGYHKGIKYDVCSPGEYPSLPDFLFQNDGKGHFVDVSKAAGLRREKKNNDEYCGKGLCVIAADFNDDFKPDLYVANDTTENFLYFNHSKPGHIKLVERAEIEGVALDDKGERTGSMGIDVGDIEGSGLPSLWVTNFEGELHALYQMQRLAGQRRFFYRTQASGAGVIGNQFVGWGTAFLDLDNNTQLDIIIANGHIYRFPVTGTPAQLPVLFENQGNGTFKNISLQGGAYFQKKHRGRGLIRADFDNNGLPDVAITHLNEPVALLKNICTTKNHWLGVELAAKDRADATGAKVILTLGKRVLTRFQKSGGSYCSTNDPRILFGLSDTSSPGKLTVYWPTSNPRIEHWENLAPGQYHRLVQGKGKS